MYFVCRPGRESKTSCLDKRFREAVRGTREVCSTQSRFEYAPPASLLIIFVGCQSPSRIALSRDNNNIIGKIFSFLMADSPETPVRYTASRIIRAKSSPTTHLTTIEPDWDHVFQETALNDNGARSVASKSRTCPSDPGTMSHSGAATFSHGLLTPHASINESLEGQDYHTARSSFRSPGRTIDYESDISEIIFASRDDSVLVEADSGLHRFPRPQACDPSSSDFASYVSVGVQTSLPYTSPSYIPTRPSSPITPNATPAASPRRRRRVTPEYVLEGARLAQELDDDLVYVSNSSGICSFKCDSHRKLSFVVTLLRKSGVFNGALLALSARSATIGVFLFRLTMLPRMFSAMTARMKILIRTGAFFSLSASL